MSRLQHNDCVRTYTCFSSGRAGSTRSPTRDRPSCGIRNFIPPPASGLDLGPGGRSRSVGDEERSHSAPSNCAVGRGGAGVGGEERRGEATIFTQCDDKRG